MMARLFLLALIVFCLELGLLVVVLPWSPLWERHYLLHRFPELAPWLMNYYLRGAISGLGLVDIGVGLGAAARFERLYEQWFERVPAAPVLASESLGRGRTA
ncbi:MAG: hypothetical protein ACRD5I_10605 [Candidatus Acidiferrales bacterium]